MADQEFLGVAKFNKPHGLKGEALVYPLTSEPDAVFATGRTLVKLDRDGVPVGEPLTIERSRAYHREWLIKFHGIDERTPLETWDRQGMLGVPKSELTPPADDQLYLHEIPGTPVVVNGEEIGVAKEVLTGPGGQLLSIAVKGKDLLIPFRKPIVKRIDRAAKRIELDPPAGLLDL